MKILAFNIMSNVLKDKSIYEKESLNRISEEDLTNLMSRTTKEGYFKIFFIFIFGISILFSWLTDTVFNYPLLSASILIISFPLNVIFLNKLKKCYKKIIENEKSNRLERKSMYLHLQKA